MVVEFFGGFQNAGTRGGLDDLEIVQHTRDRGRGDTRLLGDGVEIHSQRAPFAHEEHLKCRQAHSIENCPSGAPGSARDKGRTLRPESRFEADGS